MNTKRRRRFEAKTDYKGRHDLLRSNKNRIIFRKTNKYIIGQCVKSQEAQDYVITGVISKELLEYGWPKSTSIKSIPASYLTGFLLGKKMIEKEENSGILDIGLIRNVHGSKIYAFLKGVIDAGVEINHDKEVFPQEARLLGRHLKNSVDIHKIKSEIEKKFE